MGFVLQGVLFTALAEITEILSFSSVPPKCVIIETSRTVSQSTAQIFKAISVAHPCYSGDVFIAFPCLVSTTALLGTLYGEKKEREKEGRYSGIFSIKVD